MPPTLSPPPNSSSDDPAETLIGPAAGLRDLLGVRPWRRHGLVALPATVSEMRLVAIRLP